MATAVASFVLIENAAAADGDMMETVVVTANKRAQDELRMATSVSVLDADTLTHNRIFSVQDLGQTVPNFAVAQFGDGQYRLIYRGVGATGTSDNQNFNVAYDGTIVPYGNAYRLLDLAQLEVLRGPQGTLYGRNTNAGIINIVANDGHSDTPAIADVYYGSGNTVSVDGAFGGPVEGTGLFYRVAVRGEQTDGFISNTVLNRKNTDEGHNGTLRATVGWQSGSWLVKGALTYDRYYGLADDLTPATMPFKSIAADIGTSTGHLTMPILTAVYSGGDYTFTSVTAFANASRLLDFSAVVSPLLFGQFDRRDALSQEFRISGDTDFLGINTQWITGLFLMNENDKFTSTLQLTHPIVSPLLYQQQHENTQSAALFGEAVTNWSDHWQTTVGLRFADERQNYDYVLSAAGARLHSSRSYPAIQPKFALSYLLDKSSQIYASATRGFRAGAIFVNNAAFNPSDPSYKQEDTWQYEFGYKGLLADGHLKVEAAGFYIDWNNLQVQRSILSVSPPGVYSVVDNATKAKSYGTEGTLTWLASEGLSLFVKGGYTHAAYDNFHPTPALNYSGNFIEEVPRYSAGAGFNYVLPEGFDIAADLTNYGKMWYDAANTISQKPYTLLNASVGYAIDKWRLSVSGRNLLDEQYANRGQVSGGKAYIHAAEPAAVMGELSLRY